MASAPPEATMDVGRVLSRGFAALRANVPAFLAASLLIAGLPSFAVEYWTLRNFNMADPAFIITGTYWGVIGGTALVGLVATTLLQGVVTRSTVLHLSGRDADVGASGLLALRLLPSLIGLSLVLGVLIGLGFMVLAVPGVMIYCATLVAVPALIEERPGILGSISRSRDLTRGSRWRVLLLAILFWVFSVIVQGFVALVSGVSPMEAGQPADPLVASIAAGIGASVSTLIIAVVAAALYVELREVKEGATAEELAAVFG